MAILLRRNSQRDNWFGLHGDYIKEGDVVKLVSIANEPKRSVKYPPEISVNRGIASDAYNYTASLNCFDYIKGVK